MALLIEISIRKITNNYSTEQICKQKQSDFLICTSTLGKSKMCQRTLVSSKTSNSIEYDPEMLQLRELVAYDNNGEIVVILGNMRYRAMKELGYKDAPVKVLPPKTDAKKLRAYIQKDNIAFGQNDWDLLGNEWDVEELQDFGRDFMTKRLVIATL